MCTLYKQFRMPRVQPLKLSQTTCQSKDDKKQIHFVAGRVSIE